MSLGLQPWHQQLFLLIFFKNWNLNGVSLTPTFWKVSDESFHKCFIANTSSTSTVLCVFTPFTLHWICNNSQNIAVHTASHSSLSQKPLESAGPSESEKEARYWPRTSSRAKQSVTWTLLKRRRTMRGWQAHSRRKALFKTVIWGPLLQEQYFFLEQFTASKSTTESKWLSNDMSDVRAVSPLTIRKWASCLQLVAAVAFERKGASINHRYQAIHVL